MVIGLFLYILALNFQEEKIQTPNSEKVSTPTNIYLEEAVSENKRDSELGANNISQTPTGKKKKTTEKQKGELRAWITLTLSLLATTIALISLWFSRLEARRNKENEALDHLTNAWDYLGGEENTPEILIDATSKHPQNLKGAEREIKKAMAKAPNLPLVYIRYGDFFRARGNEAEALRQYEKAISLDSSNAKAYRRRGMILHSQGNTIEAIQNLNEAVEIDHEDYLAYYNRGICKKSQRALAEAFEDYSKCIEINPSFAPGWVNRGIVCIEQGEIKDAIMNFTKAIDRNPQDPVAYYNRGLIYKNQKMLYHAISDFSFAIKLKPDHLKALYNRGTIFKEMGILQKAFQDFSETIEYRSTAPWRDVQLTMSQIDDELKKNPFNFFALYNQALVHASNGEFLKAVEAMQQCIKVIENDTPIPEEELSSEEEADFALDPKSDSFLAPNSLIDKLVQGEDHAKKQNAELPLVGGLSGRQYQSIFCKGHKHNRIAHLRILIVVQNCGKRLYIDPQEELAQVRSSWKGASVSLKLLDSPSIDEVKNYILDNDRFDIVHFKAHGKFHKKSNTGYLLFKKNSADVDLVDGDQLARALNFSGEKQPGLVTLIACESGKLNKEEQFLTNSVALKLEQMGFPFVIGMQRSICPENAALFSRCFYQKLQQNQTPADALRHASQNMARRDHRSLEWASPVLFGNQRAGSFLLQ